MTSVGDGLDGVGVLVTGGASGIGAATAALFLEAGARVAVMDRVAVDEAGGLVSVVADVGDDGAVRRAVGEVVERFGGLGVLVNNVGVGAVGSVEDNPDDEWHRVFDVNVLGLVRVSRAALPALRTSRGAIVNVCSIVATAGLPRRALYGASKGAVLSLTLAMAADSIADGVRVNCVNPGTVGTPWVEGLLAASEDPVGERARLVARQPHGRLVSAAEVAAAIVFLASPLSGSTTGTALAVDGGMQGLRLAPKQD